MYVGSEARRGDRPDAVMVYVCVRQEDREGDRPDAGRISVCNGRHD